MLPVGAHSQLSPSSIQTMHKAVARGDSGADVCGTERAKEGTMLLNPARLHTTIDEVLYQKSCCVKEYLITRENKTTFSVLIKHMYNLVLVLVE